MAISKVLKCSRAFPLGKVDHFQRFTCLSGLIVLIFVKYTTDYFDVLCFQSENLYICRYKFPRYSWYVEDIVDYLKKEL